ncbi:MAG: DNA polymerase IV [Gemmatimonadota bacterium]
MLVARAADFDLTPRDGLRQTEAKPIDTSPNPKEPAASRGSPRRILHVDCDAFFVQVARLEDPEGAGKASLLIVGGSPSGRGVVTSASYEARAYGVRSAMPTGQALRLCPNATVVSVPRGAVGARSTSVRLALQELAPVVEAASVDEFYLDLTGTERLFKGESLAETADRIRRAVVERTEISTSVGGGSNRLIAKLATSRAKPAGVHIVAAGGEGAFMKELELGAIPGVGPALLAELEKRGLRTVRQALEVGPEWLARWLGASRGAWLQARLQGIGNDEVDPERERKSISSERTFRADIDEDEALELWLLRLAESVGHTLREKGLRTRTVTVKLKDFDFRVRSRALTLPQPIESDRAIRDTAHALLQDLRRDRLVPARLLGVGLGGLEAGDAPRQLALFEDVAGPGETDRERELSRAVDRVRQRFGRDAVAAARLTAPPTTDDERGERSDG